MRRSGRWATLIAVAVVAASTGAMAARAARRRARPAPPVQVQPSAEVESPAEPAPPEPTPAEPPPPPRRRRSPVRVGSLALLVVAAVLLAEVAAVRATQPAAEVGVAAPASSWSPPVMPEASSWNPNGITLDECDTDGRTSIVSGVDGEVSLCGEDGMRARLSIASLDEPDASGSPAAPSADGMRIVKFLVTARNTGPFAFATDLFEDAWVTDEVGGLRRRHATTSTAVHEEPWEAEHNFTFEVPESSRLAGLTVAVRLGAGTQLAHWSFVGAY